MSSRTGGDGGGVRFQDSGNQAQRSNILGLTPVQSAYKPFVDEQDEEIKSLDTRLDYGPIPLVRRKVSDVISLIIFLCFSIYLLVVSIMAFTNGNPAILVKPQDPEGRFCGQGEAKDYPFIYWVNPMLQESLHRTVCVKKCPSGIMDDFLNAKLECLTNSIVETCSYKFQPLNESILKYDSVPYLGRICLSRSRNYFNSSKGIMVPPRLNAWLGDLKNSYQAQLISMAGTILLGFLCIIIIQKSPICAVWSFIGFYFAALIGLIVFFLYEYSNEDILDVNKNFQDEETLKSVARESSNSQGYYLLFGILAILLLVISLVIFIFYVFFSKKFKEMIEILSYSKDFLRENTLIWLTPLFTSLAMLLYLVWWLFVSAFMISIGQVKEMPINERTPFNQFENSSFYYFNTILHILSLFYFLCFIMSFNFYIIGGAAAYYYFKGGVIFPKQERERRSSVIKEQGLTPNTLIIYG